MAKNADGYNEDAQYQDQSKGFFSKLVDGLHEQDEKADRYAKEHDGQRPRESTLDRMVNGFKEQDKSQDSLFAKEAKEAHAKGQFSAQEKYEIQYGQGKFADQDYVQKQQESLAEVRGELKGKAEAKRELKSEGYVKEPKNRPIDSVDAHSVSGNSTNRATTSAVNGTISQSGVRSNSVAPSSQSNSALPSSGSIQNVVTSSSFLNTPSSATSIPQAAALQQKKSYEAELNKIGAQNDKASDGQSADNKNNQSISGKGTFDPTPNQIREQDFLKNNNLSHNQFDTKLASLEVTLENQNNDAKTKTGQGLTQAQIDKEIQQAAPGLAKAHQNDVAAGNVNPKDATLLQSVQNVANKTNQQQSGATNQSGAAVQSNSATQAYPQSSAVDQSNALQSSNGSQFNDVQSNGVQSNANGQRLTNSRGRETTSALTKFNQDNAKMVQQAKQAQQQANKQAALTK